jgi:putative peptidoglycan lipid II flippase
VLVNIVLNLALFRIMGHVGLALATSAAACVNAFLLWRGLRISGRCQVTRLTAWSMGRCLLATLAMIAALWWITPGVDDWLLTTVSERSLWLLRSVAVGGCVYLVAIWLIGGRLSQLKHLA